MGMMIADQSHGVTTGVTGESREVVRPRHMFQWFHAILADVFAFHYGRSFAYPCMWLHASMLTRMMRTYDDERSTCIVCVFGHGYSLTAQKPCILHSQPAVVMASYQEQWRSRSQSKICNPIESTNMKKTTTLRRNRSSNELNRDFPNDEYLGEGGGSNVATDGSSPEPEAQTRGKEEAVASRPKCISAAANQEAKADL